MAVRVEVEHRDPRAHAAGSEGPDGRTLVGDARWGRSLVVWWGNLVFRYRNLLFPVALISLFAGFPPHDPHGQLHDGLAALGLALAFAGQSLRAAVAGYVTIRRSGKNHRIYAERLITEGLFRHSRNPLYLGNLLILSGLFLIHNNAWAYAGGILFFILTYGAMVAAEEAYLQTRFGAEYEAYCRRVNRWLPRLGEGVTCEGVTCEGMTGRPSPSHPLTLSPPHPLTPFSWRRVIRLEHGSAYTWCVTALLLLTRDTLARTPSDQHQTGLNSLAALLVLATAAWAAARLLRKAGRLED